MVISSDFLMGQHRDADHQEDAPHFNFSNAAKVDQSVFFDELVMNFSIRNFEVDQDD